MKSLSSNRKYLRWLVPSVFVVIPLAATAKNGAVDYSWGADGLEEATTFLGTMMIYTVDILYAVAAVMVVISALEIYIKMTFHEGDVTKSIMMLIGGILFMIGAMIVMPAFFGYQDMTFVF